jgi:hypothetical protein
MRNLDLIDAVIQLHDVARLVEQEIGEGNLSHDIRNCADRLHLHSIQDGHNTAAVNNVIDKAAKL